MRISDAERKVLTIVWDTDGITAKELSERLAETTAWSKTTSYTMITRCINKGYLRREDPKFRCYAVLSREQVAKMETDALLQNDYHGSADMLVAALVSEKKLSAKQLEALYRSVAEIEQ